MKPVSSMRVFLALLLSFILILGAKVIAYSYFLQGVWTVMQDQGFLRLTGIAGMGIGIFILVVILAVWILSEFWKKAADGVEVVYYSLLAGLLFSLPEITQYFFFQFQWELPVGVILSNLIGFGLAGLAFGLLIFRKK